MAVLPSAESATLQPNCAAKPCSLGPCWANCADAGGRKMAIGNNTASQNRRLAFHAPFEDLMPVTASFFLRRSEGGGEFVSVNSAAVNSTVHGP
ncbi:hypothetical protein SBA4_2570005 [Candidatus Sulfopaludibacter sp. SbA4]|nr:hypothetical protein SBA4_2570005 [Candidatus Sulfopaludibacter sp. SbA4]